MTVNIRFGLADDGPNNWIYRKNRFASLFQIHKVDFIAMQEVNNFQKDYFQEILQDYNFIGKRTPAPSNWQ
ncbi:MAG: metal-dependent hydrolase, partial [Deltaproteobacteria bacterium]|nr:metal-dependent hydrolase [Deltaproteobacteria bacterium]